MPVPTHREDCKTRTWLTRCQYCGKQVWYFSCSCGSKVFFDSKGWPWPLHQDNCPMYNIELMVNDGVSPHSIRRLLESNARSNTKEIPPEVIAFLDGLDRDVGSKKKPIISVLPGDESIDISGTVIEFHPINFYKRLDIDENPIYRKILGELSQEPYTEVIVREKVGGTLTSLHQWTFIVPTRDVNYVSFRKDVFIRASLEAHLISLDEEQAFWKARWIDWD